MPKIVKNGTAYGSSPAKLDEISDVTITSPQANQVVARNSSNNGWQNKTLLGTNIVNDTSLSASQTIAERINTVNGNIYSNFVRFNLGYGLTLSTTVGRNQWLVLLSDQLYIVWFYSTNSISVRNVGTNERDIGQNNTATLGDVTFTRGENNILTVTSSATNYTMTILG